MCNLYRIETSQQAMRRLFSITDDRLGNLPLFEGIYPDQSAPVIRNDGAGGRAAEMMRWGFPPPAKARRPATNVRNLDSPFWRTWLASPEGRCLIPATAFCEYEGEAGAKQKRWFRVTDDRPDGLFAFAGIWRGWTGRRGKEEGPFSLYAMLTTEANALVAPIHPQAMPVILDGPGAWDAWLAAPWPDARSFVRPFPAERMALMDDLPLFTSN